MALREGRDLKFCATPEDGNLRCDQFRNAVRLGVCFL